MASNLFQLNPNFLTHKCPSLSTKRHLFKHTEIYGSSEMIAYAPQDIFNPCLLLYCCALVKKMRPDQNAKIPISETLKIVDLSKCRRCGTFTNSSDPLGARTVPGVWHLVNSLRSVQQAATWVLAPNEKRLQFLQPFVIRLGLEPKTPTLKVLCSTY